MTPMLAAALELRSWGFSVLPIAGHDWVARWTDRDSKEVRERSLRKAPAFEDGGGYRGFKWKHLQSHAMDDEEMRRYMTRSPNIGVVFGEVSGFAECIDFDEPGYYEAWREVLVEHGHGELVERLTVQATQTPGHYQVLYRCPEGIQGNQKLAKRHATPEEISIRPDEKVVGLIETRGEGGYALVVPSQGYRVVQGGFDAVPIVTTEERGVLLDFARHFDAIPPEPTPDRPKQSADRCVQGLTPGDDFDRRGDWHAILEKHGWRASRRHGRLTVWTRPGKDGSATSAHTGLGHHGIDFLVVFTSNGWPLEPTPMKYGKFRAYCVLNHGGDAAAHQSAAAKELYREGYGERIDSTKGASSGSGNGPASVHRGTTAETSSLGLKGDEPVADPPDGSFEPASVGDEPSSSARWWAKQIMTVDQVMEQPDKDMLVKDLIGRQDRWMWAGAPGCGKTFGILNLLVACAIGGEFAGFDVPRPLRVAYCSSEGRFKMKNRLSAVLDQFGVTLDDVRPFMRFFPEVPQYHETDGEQGILGFAEALRMQGFLPDILSIDTLSTATLGSKEQDNSEAARVCETANQVGRYLNCSTGFLHHTGWEGGRPRGASAFFGAMDVVLLQERIGETKAGTIKCFKGKDIDSFRPISYRLVGVAEHDTAIMEFGESDEVEAELTALQQILIAMGKRPDREWWTVAELLDITGDKGKRSAFQNTLRRHSDSRPGNMPVFEWNGSAKPFTYRRTLQ